MSSSIPLKPSTRQSDSTLTVTETREELQRKCCLIRLQYHPCYRLAFEIVWRLLFLMDTFFDIALCLQYIAFSKIWWFFVSVYCIPYLILSFILFLPFYRRTINEHSQKPIIFQICVIAFYTLLSLPCIVILDLHICFRLCITDLSTTRYYLYYWRLKTLVEITFEAIPQTLILICIGMGLLDSSQMNDANINVHMLYGSLSISVLYLCYYCFVIMAGAKSTQLSICEYLYKYYIMQGIDMIPYQEAITQNLLSDFILTSENLTSYEWKQLIKDLFRNFSIVKFDISGQQNLHFSLWTKLFKCLCNNNLTVLKLNACFIFHPDNITNAQKPIKRFRDSFYRRNATTELFNKYEMQKVDKKTSLRNLQTLKANFQALILNVPSLVIVDISNNCLQSVFRDMIKPISKLKKLRELYVAQNKLTESELNENEYNMLFRGCVSLQILDLSDNMLCDADVDLICKAMQKCKDRNQLRCLKKINLNANKVSIEGANQLLTIMPQFGDMSVSLRNNDIEDELFADMQNKTAIELIM